MAMAEELPVPAADQDAVKVTKMKMKITSHREEEDVSKLRLRPRPRSVKRFAPHVSPMDPADPRSQVFMSEFRGLYHLALICAGVYALSVVIANVETHGTHSDWYLMRAVFASPAIVEVFVTFGCQALFAYTAMLPVWMFATAGSATSVRRRLVNPVHHFLQSVLFFGTVACIVYRNWNTVHGASAFFECLVLIMKMHSYVRTKIELSRYAEKPPTQSLQEFTMYLLFPTLVFEPEYPRTERIRWGYFGEKLLANTLAMFMFYAVITDHVLPSLQSSGMSNPVFVIVHLLLPIMGCMLLFWFIVFECILNGIAELTRFADRDFYGDWWNSTTFDEYARLWNKPVHEFLLRHVYLESLETYKLSKKTATTLTFVVSSLLHECLFVLIFHTVKMYFFVLQMLQVLLILYGRGLKGTRLGNYIFWIGMILGVPLQAVIYCREYYGGDPIFVRMMMPIMLAGFLSVAVGSIVMIRKPKAPKTKTSKTKISKTN